MQTETPAVLNSIIAESCNKSLAKFQKYLVEHYPEIQIQGVAQTFEQCIESILDHEPDIVFMNLNIHPERWFKIIGKLNCRPFETIYISKNEEFATEAIERGKGHSYFMLKPVAPSDLNRSISGIVGRKQAENPNSLKLLYERLDMMTRGFSKIRLQNANGFELVEVRNIIRCKANGNYTDFFIQQNQQVKMKRVCRPIKCFQQELQQYGILRVHKSHLINIDHITSFMHGTDLQLSDGSKVMLSNSYKDAFLGRMNGVHSQGLEPVSAF